MGKIEREGGLLQRGEVRVLGLLALRRVLEVSLHLGLLGLLLDDGLRVRRALLRAVGHELLVVLLGLLLVVPGQENDPQARLAKVFFFSFLLPDFAKL